MSSPKSFYLGAFFITFAFGFVSLMGALAKYAVKVPVELLVFFQSFVALLVLLPWALRAGVIVMKTSYLGTHFFRSFFGLASQVCMIIAVKHMALMDSTLLANSAPIFIPLVFLVVYKQKSPKLTWLGILLGFVGVAFVLKPGRSLIENPVSLLALASALFSALALVFVNRLTRTENVEEILIYYFLWSSLLAAPGAILSWVAPATADWLILAAIGLAMGIAQFLIVKAYQRASASALAPFNYSVVVFSGIIGWCVWQDRPDALALIGVILVALGGVLSLRGMNHASDQRRAS